jgi:hypothetical protein
MTYKIACYTLFDITQTGVINRSTPPVDANLAEWTLKRNTQCNFDTVLQVISLRSQPEIIVQPQRLPITKDTKHCFGDHYKFNKNSTHWRFEFYIQHASVFNNGISELGALYSDSNNVPMILIGTEIDSLSNSLNTTTEHRNIYYEIISHEYEPDS